VCKCYLKGIVSVSMCRGSEDIVMRVELIILSSLIVFGLYNDDDDDDDNDDHDGVPYWFVYKHSRN